jgi:hypothetical protein
MESDGEIVDSDSSLVWTKSHCNHES